MDIQAVCSAIATTLATNIDGLRAYDTSPDTPAVPSVVVTLGTDNEEETFDAVMRPFNITVLLSSANRVAGQQALQSYVSTDGVNSIRRVIDANPSLGGVVKTAWIEPELKSYGTIKDDAGVEYYSARLTCTVWA